MVPRAAAAMPVVHSFYQKTALAHMEPIIEIGRENSYFNHLLAQMRDKQVQQDRMRFRRNMERIGSILGYEMSKHFEYAPREIQTPLGSTRMDVPRHQPVITSILRAGIPFHQGLLDFFDEADSAFVSAYRHHTEGNRFVVKLEYIAAPDLHERMLILADPMIATGRSMITAWEALQERGAPSSLFIAAIIASEEGMEYVRRHLPQARLFVGAIDAELTAKSYIVPGLGDAGDLAFGLKE